MNEGTLEPIDIPDKRLDKRLTKNLKISYTTLSKIDVKPFEFGNSITVDISRNGLSLMVDEPIDVPILMQVKLHVSGEKSDMVILGKTVYCSRLEEEDMYRVGIRFVGMLPVDLGRVLEEIQKLGNPSNRG